MSAIGQRTAGAGLVLAVLLAACMGAAAPEPSPTPEPTPGATEQATPTPTPGPTPVGQPDRCGEGEAALAARLVRLEADIRAAMQGYPGEWAVGLVDLDCDVKFVIHAEHFQYTASAGKIVPVIAALRAVDESTVDLPRAWEPPPQRCGTVARVEADGGTIDFASIEEALLLVMRHSCDHEADVINAAVTPEEIQEVLEIAGVSERVRYTPWQGISHSWRGAGMPALDLARVWAALIDGRLLDEGLTAYLLDLSARAEIPAGLETFPTDVEIPGYQFGRKAGYCIVCPGYSLIGLGAGFLRPVEELSEEGTVGGTRAGPHRGVAMVLMVQTRDLNARDPQRRSVFPLLVDYVVGAR